MNDDLTQDTIGIQLWSINDCELVSELMIMNHKREFLWTNITVFYFRGLWFFVMVIVFVDDVALLIMWYFGDLIIVFFVHVAFMVQIYLSKQLYFFLFVWDVVSVVVSLSVYAESMLGGENIVDWLMDGWMDCMYGWLLLWWCLVRKWDWDILWDKILVLVYMMWVWILFGRWR